MAPGSGAADAHKGVEIPVTTSSAGSKDTGPDVDENSDSCFLEWLPVSCWSIIVDELAAKDLLCLSMTSKVVSCQLGGVPGLWTQACSNSLGMHSTTAAACSNSSCSHTSHAIQPPRHSTIYSNQHNPTFAISQQQHDDQQAQQILSSLVALAHTTGNLKPQLKPQSYLLPPWLGAQPGKARGFVRVESPAVLNPGLVLTEAQVYWLSWGCLSGGSVYSKDLLPASFSEGALSAQLCVLLLSHSHCAQLDNCQQQQSQCMSDICHQHRDHWHVVHACLHCCRSLRWCLCYTLHQQSPQ